MLKDILPGKYRKLAYLVFAILVVVDGGLTVGFAAAGADLPLAVVVAEKVLLYVGGAFGFVARANVPPETLSEPR